MVVSLFRTASALVVVTSALTLPSFAATPAPGPVDVLRTVMADFNRGDGQAAMGSFASEGSATDEFAPYQWRGPGAFTAWVSALGDWEKGRSRTGDNMKIESVTRSDVEGDSAYVVLHMLYSFKEHGHRMSEPGDFTFAMSHGADGWKISSMTWSGGHPGPVVAKAKAPAVAGAAVAPPKKS